MTDKQNDNSKNSTYWTDVRIKKLKTHFKEGLSGTRIAELLGGDITRSAVMGKLNRLGLKQKNKEITTKKILVDVEVEVDEEKKKEKARAKERERQKERERERERQKSKSKEKEEKGKSKVKDEKGKKKEKEKKVNQEKDKPGKDDFISTKELIEIFQGKTEKIDPSKPVTIMSLTEKTCRWPIGDPFDDDFHFCGKETDVDDPYCKEHSEISYQQPKRAEPVAKKIASSSK